MGKEVGVLKEVGVVKYGSFIFEEGMRFMMGFLEEGVFFNFYGDLGRGFLFFCFG